MLGNTDAYAISSELSRQTVVVKAFADGDQSRRDLLTWVNVLQNNLPSLIFVSPSAEARLGNFDVLLEEIDSAPTSQKMKDLWQSLNALDVISAHSGEDNTKTILSARIFLGDLLGPVGSSWIFGVEQEISKSQYRFQRDFFALLTLYVLAVDTSQIGAPPVETCNFLSEASNILLDIGLSLPHVQTIASAISILQVDTKCPAAN